MRNYVPSAMEKQSEQYRMHLHYNMQWSDNKVGDTLNDNRQYCFRHVKSQVSSTALRPSNYEQTAICNEHVCAQMKLWAFFLLLCSPVSKQIRAMIRAVYEGEVWRVRDPPPSCVCTCLLVCVCAWCLPLSQIKSCHTSAATAADK